MVAAFRKPADKDCLAELLADQVAAHRLRDLSQQEPSITQTVTVSADSVKEAVAICDTGANSYSVYYYQNYYHFSERQCNAC